MKQFRLLIAALLWPAAWAAAQNPDHDFEEMVCKEAAAHAEVVTARGGPMTFEDPSFDLKYYRFEWAVDPAVYQIGGKATAYFTAKKNGLATLEFNLSTQLTVDAIKFQGSNIAFSQNGTYGLTVSLPAPLALGATDSVSITYHGVPPSGGFGSFIQSSHAGVPIIWTLSEPFGAQDWWPCKNGLTDKVDSLDVFVTTPEQYRAASNGLLVGETATGSGSKTYHWKHRYPIAPYLVAIAVTNYEQYTDIVPLSNGVQMPMLNYVYPENLADAKAGTADMVQVVQFYDSLFVNYPFFKEKYGHAQFGWGGGMEHQTMSFVINYGWGLLAHEMAHQWFGDMITCASWEDIWLNEGFATFLEGLTRERFPFGMDWYNWRKLKIDNVTSQPNGSVRVDDTTSVNRIFSGRLSYNKGAYLLHMLRWKLGDKAFFNGIRAYANTAKFKFAKTPALVAQLEAASGQDLTEFFKDWYYGQGWPSYQLQWAQDAGKKLTVTLGQTQSDPSVSFFEMPVPVRFSGQGQDTVLRLENTFSGQTFMAQLPFAVDAVEFDPDLWLLSANNSIQQVSATGSAAAFPGSLDALPNPAHGQFSAVLQLPAAEVVRFSLVNALGVAVRESSEVVPAGRFERSFDVGNLPAGAYFLTAKGASGWLARRPVALF